MDKSILIGITGGSGSGKTTIVKKISEHLSDFVFIPQDNYYKSADHSISNDNITSFNFDHPDAFDSDLIIKHLKDLKEGKSIEMPTYDFVHHCRAEKTVKLEPRSTIIFEGIMVFFEKRIRDLMDLKIFVDTPSDIRFTRRLQRDIKERGRTVDSVIEQYLEVVRPGHIEFIEPTKVYADLIVPEGGNNQKALDVLLSYIKSEV